MRFQTAHGEQTRHPECATTFGKRGRGRSTVVGFTIFRSLNTRLFAFYESFQARLLDVYHYQFLGRYSIANRNPCITRPKLADFLAEIEIGM